jgi:hypothetical protein
MDFEHARIGARRVLRLQLSGEIRDANEECLNKFKRFLCQAHYFASTLIR